MQHVYFLLAITTFALFSSVSCLTDDEKKAVCGNRSKTDCWTCIRADHDCAYCKNSGACFYYNKDMLLTPPCGTTDLQYGTCVGKCIMICESLNEDERENKKRVSFNREKRMFEGGCTFQWEMMDYFRRYIGAILPLISFSF